MDLLFNHQHYLYSLTSVCRRERGKTGSRQNLRSRARGVLHKLRLSSRIGHPADWLSTKICPPLRKFDIRAVMAPWHPPLKKDTVDFQDGHIAYEAGQKASRVAHRYWLLTVGFGNPLWISRSWHISDSAAIKRGASPLKILFVPALRTYQ